MKENRALLRPEHAHKPPPFAAAQYTEAAFSRIVRLIWTNASQDTRGWYALGQSQNGDNWVILWMLYHVCRYRDNRNKARATSRNFHDDDNLDDNAGEGKHGVLTTERYCTAELSANLGPSTAPSTSAPTYTASVYYDAARNGYRPCR